MQDQSEALSGFHEQIRFALNRYESHQIKANEVKNILICGLGGSGIAGRIISEFYYAKSPIPIQVVSDYQLPAYADSNSLIILSSYSGNTEETLSLFEEAKTRNARIIVISSGGRLTELANQTGCPVYYSEPGYQPRMALGYGLTYLFRIFDDLFGLKYGKLIDKHNKMLSGAGNYKNKAKKLLNNISGNTLNHKWVIISDRSWSAVATRFCQQLQENAKSEAYTTLLPEANHNIIETYTEKHQSIFLFLTSAENPRITKRVKFLKSLLRQHKNNVIEFKPMKVEVSKLFNTIYLLDWLSLEMAATKGVDPAIIPNIIALKDFMASGH